MDIAALSTSMSLATVNNDISVAVLTKNLDTVEEMSEGLQKMMELSVNPNLGANIDVSL